MTRKKIGPFADIIEVDDAETIRSLAHDEKVDRAFKFHPPVNGFILARLIRNLSYKGAHFPHMTAKNDEVRQLRHDQLWQAFNARAAAMADGPEELDALARWVRHETNEPNPGVLVQQILGQFFYPNFKATSESYQAALVLREDAVSKNLPKMVWWQIIGKAHKAKELLGSMVNDDIVAMHAIGVALHNLVATTTRLQSFYADEHLRNTLTPAMAVEQSLSAPPVVYRQALLDGAAAGCPYSKSALFMLKLKDANKNHDANDMIFMSGTWSRCPAEQWIPAVVKGIWKRAAGREG